MYYWFTLVLYELSWGRFLSVGNVIRLRKIQLYISNSCPPSHCSVGNLWQADSHPRASCLTFFSWGVTDRAETFITYFYSCVSVVFIVCLWSPVLFVKLWWSVQWDVWQQSSSSVSRCTGTQRIFRRNEWLKSVSWCTKTQACWYICCIIFSFYWNTSGLKRVIKLKKKKEKKTWPVSWFFLFFLQFLRCAFFPASTCSQRIVLLCLFLLWKKELSVLCPSAVCVCDFSKMTQRCLTFHGRASHRTSLSVMTLFPQDYCSLGSRRQMARLIQWILARSNQVINQHSI